MTQLVSDWRRSKTYLILEATFVRPFSRKFAVSITTKSQPILSASASQIVDFAVPGGPNSFKRRMSVSFAHHVNEDTRKNTTKLTIAE